MDRVELQGFEEAGADYQVLVDGEENGYIEFEDGFYDLHWFTERGLESVMNKVKDYFDARYDTEPADYLHNSWVYMGKPGDGRNQEVSSESMTRIMEGVASGKSAQVLFSEEMARPRFRELAENLDDSAYFLPHESLPDELEPLGPVIEPVYTQAEAAYDAVKNEVSRIQEARNPVTWLNINTLDRDFWWTSNIDDNPHMTLRGGNTFEAEDAAVYLELSGITAGEALTEELVEAISEKTATNL